MRPPRLALLLALVAGAACAAEPTASKASPAKAPEALASGALPVSLAGGPDSPAGAIVLSKVTFVQSRGNAVFARGTFATLTYARQSGETLASAAAVRFPREGRTDHAVDLSAPRARGNPLEQRVVGEGGVRVQNQRGDRGETRVAAYDGQAGVASGTTPVHLVGPGFTSDSPGFRWQAAEDLLDLGPSAVVTRGRAP